MSLDEKRRFFSFSCINICKCHIFFVTLRAKFKVMIQYPYIPPITGATAERIAKQADYNFQHRRGIDAPSREELESSRQMFQQAGLFL